MGRHSRPVRHGGSCGCEMCVLAMFGVLYRETERWLKLKEMQTVNEAVLVIITAEQITRDAAKRRR